MFFAFPNKYDYFNVFPVLGGKLAIECNFPEDIFTKGMYDQWDVKECIKNLQQLIQMHE